MRPPLTRARRSRSWPRGPDHLAVVGRAAAAAGGGKEHLVRHLRQRQRRLRLGRVDGHEDEDVGPIRRSGGRGRPPLGTPRT
jgi:hypothetical protein